MEDYKIRAITSWDEINKFRPFWQRTQWHPGADLNFFELILKGRSTVISPCVFILTNNDQIIALLAGRIEHSKIQIRLGYATLAKIAVRKLVLMEGGFMGNRTDDVWTKFLAFVCGYLREANLGLASFENVRLTSPQYTIAKQMFGRSQLSSGNSAEHWLLQLPKKYEDFMAGRSKKRRYWLNRLPRVLDKDFPGEWSMVRYSSANEVQDFAAAAETVACKTYHRGLGVGFQANDETIKRLTMEAGLNQLCSYVLFIKKEPKAFWHCFKYANVLYLASTGYDPEYGSYEVGTVLLLKVFQDYCGTDINVVDFGLGDADYKQRYGSEHFTETTLVLFPRTIKGVYLNFIKSSGDATNQTIRKMVDRLHLTQRMKKIWRRGKSASTKSSPDNQNPHTGKSSSITVETEPDEPAGRN